MDNISSGLHRYAGNPAHTKFRIVFTDPSQGSVSEASLRANSTSNYNQITKKSTSMKQETHSTAGVCNLDELHQASFIIAKHPETGNWIANEEEPFELEAGPATTSSAINAKTNDDKESNCLATILRREGFKLSVTTLDSSNQPSNRSPTRRLRASRAQLCNCQELTQGYKTYQRSSTRLPSTTMMTSSKRMANLEPLNDNLMSLFWMESNGKQQEKQKSDCAKINIETLKFFNRKLAKLIVTQNEQQPQHQQQQSDYNSTLDHHNSSCDHEGVDSLQADNIDLIQETNDLCELGDEEDFLFDATRALGIPQAESKSSDETVNLNIKRRLKTLNSTPATANTTANTTATATAADTQLDSFQGVPHLECCCCDAEAHCETLLVKLHRPRSVALRTNLSEKIGPTDETNGAAILSDTAVDSIDATDSGAIISAATLVSDNGNRANVDKTTRLMSDDETDDLIGNENEAEKGQRKSDSYPDPLLKDGDLGFTDASQPNDSIVLTTIVIDAFNRTVQVTPDLNKLVMLDLSTLDAPQDEALDASALMAAAGDEQSRTTRTRQILYHLETFNHASELSASERDLDLLRRSLGLHKFYENPIHSMSRTLIDYRLNSLCADPFSAWAPAKVLLKLQLDIGCVRNLSSSFWNLYIKYKILVKKNDCWHVRKLSEEQMERHGRAHRRNFSGTSQAEDRLFRLQTISASQVNHNRSKDKTNLEHVTHLGRSAWRHALPSPAVSIGGTSHTNSVASSIVASMATDNECHSGNIDQHKVINVTSVMKSRRLEDSLSDNEADDANASRGYDDDYEDNYQLLLEASTITSRPDSSGRFNFCCVEQLLLELSSRQQEPPSDAPKGAARDQRKFSATRMDQDDAKIPATSKTIAHEKKIAAQIDEQKSSKSNDRNQMQTPNGEVVRHLGNLPTDDRLIPPKSSELERRPPPLMSGANDEQISSNNFVVITNENYPIKSEINHETDHHSVQSPSDSDQMTDGNDDDGDEQQSRVGLINPETSDKLFQSKDLKSLDSAVSKDNKSMRPRAKSSREAPQPPNDNESFDVNNNNLCTNDGSYESNTCELIILFEIYSRDFYTDKLKGWSSMKVPISLGKKSVINNNITPQANSYQINNQIGGRASSQSQGRAKSAHHHDRCRRELPVMRPALNGPMDFLRYHILGDIPSSTPNITSFVRSDCRYMTHTQHCGNLVVRLDTLRQHR